MIENLSEEMWRLDVILKSVSFEEDGDFEVDFEIGGRLLNGKDFRHKVVLHM